MALGGFKNFATGAVLTETDLDDYLMGQALMHFATTAARDSAISSPVAGMHVVIDASIRLWQFYSGSAWVTFQARGNGSPEGVVTALRGAVFQRDDGGVGTSLYVKESDTTNTGWVAVATGASALAPANDGAEVTTDQSTTSTSMTDLTTTGPAATVTTGTKALVIVSAGIYNDTADKAGYMHFAVSGASTVAADTAKALVVRGVVARYVQASKVIRVTGLTAGSNTFTAKYATETGGTAHFTQRQIAAINMGS